MSVVGRLVHAPKWNGARQVSARFWDLFRQDLRTEASPDVSGAILLIAGLWTREEGRIIEYFALDRVLVRLIPPTITVVLEGPKERMSRVAKDLSDAFGELRVVFSEVASQDPVLLGVHVCQGPLTWPSEIQSWAEERSLAIGTAPPLEDPLLGCIEAVRIVRERFKT